VLFVEQSAHKTNGKHTIYAHMCDTARHCELIIIYELHLGLRSELCSGIIPLFIRNDVCCFCRKRIWKTKRIKIQLSTNFMLPQATPTI
jgi:hypothetical protein